jgi:pyruvate kinase
MNVARLNFAHGTLQEHRESIRPTRAEDVFSLNTVECGKVKADPV